jgi:hypothetical protein
MGVSLCVPARFLLLQDSVVMELAARHRITSIAWDENERDRRQYDVVGTCLGVVADEN